MRQFFVSETLVPGTEISCDENERKYLTQVLRLKEGARFPGITRNEQELLLEITHIDANNVRLKVISVLPRSRKEKPEIILYQCLPKGKKMDLIVRQAVEAGVNTIVPVISEFTVSRPETRKQDSKISRWQKIIREALQQSGSKITSEITQIMNFSIALQQMKKNALALFFHQAPLENSFLHGYLSAYSDSIALMIGPEGGLSSSETELLLKNGIMPAYLGKNVLRAETAAIYAIAAVKTILLEKPAWEPVKIPLQNK